MASTASSSVSGKPTDEQWAIATGDVEQPGQAKMPPVVPDNSNPSNKAAVNTKAATSAGTQASPQTLKVSRLETKTAPDNQTKTADKEAGEPESSVTSPTAMGKGNSKEKLETAPLTPSEETEADKRTNLDATSRTNDSGADSASQPGTVSGKAESSTAEDSAPNPDSETLSTIDPTTTTKSNETSPVLQDNSSLNGNSEEGASPGEDSQTSQIPLPQDNLTTAQKLDSPDFALTGSLAQDAPDLYQFTVEETGIFTASLSNLSADADVQLIQDKNSNGQVDAGEIVAWEWEKGNQDESIRHFLEQGDYVLRVLEQDLDPAPTEYSVTTTFEAAETDNRAFSINVVYQLGSDQLNEQAQAAVEQAANYWETVISYSSFDRPLELALGIYGTTSVDPPYLAYGGPYSYLNTGETGEENTEDKLLPVVGVAVINNLYIDEYNSTPNYLESVLRHEIGHVLGLGVTWDRRGNDLVDQDNGIYRAETYAGQAYGDLLGTGLATEVPLDLDSLTHWDEDVFDTELLTPRAEGIGEPLPLSQLTISSLRDLGWHVNYGAAEAFSLGSSEAIA